MQQVASIKILTQRELEILKLVSQGLTSKEIGEKLGVSMFTIESHRSNILKKLNVKKTTSVLNLYFSQIAVQ